MTTINACVNQYYEAAEKLKDYWLKGFLNKVCTIPCFAQGCLSAGPKVVHWLRHNGHHKGIGLIIAAQIRFQHPSTFCSYADEVVQGRSNVLCCKVLIFKEGIHALCDLVLCKLHNGIAHSHMVLGNCVVQQQQNGGSGLCWCLG